MIEKRDWRSFPSSSPEHRKERYERLKAQDPEGWKAKRKAEYDKAVADGTRQAHQKKYYQKNADKIKLRCKEYAKKNSERCAESRRKYYQDNKEIIKARAKEWSRHNPADTVKKRKHQLRSKYDISVEEFNNLLQFQNHKCAICNLEDFGKKGPMMDHCHSTGKNRGILCRGCNTGLGNFKDDISKLISAVSYINKYR